MADSSNALDADALDASTLNASTLDAGTPAERSRRRLGWLGMLFFTLLFVAATGAGLAWGGWQNLCDTSSTECPSIAQIHTYEAEQASKMYDRHGRIIADKIGDQQRTPVAIGDLPPHVPQAFIAIEDKRFYQHNGLDLRGITRAVVGVLRTRSLSGGGGSTITQQLARNMWTDELGFEKRILRKIKEWRVALRLERAYSKDEILEAYMNQIGYARGLYGLQEASTAYFGKNAIDMNPAEGALLAAIANRPEHYTPINDPEAAVSRRNLVLTMMAQQGYLSPEEAERWKQEDVPRELAQSVEETAPYFVEWVRTILYERFGPRLLYTAGLQIHTTLDLEMQAAAEASMAKGWDAIEARAGFSHPTYQEFAETAEGKQTNVPYVQGMFVASDPETGHVRAMIGGRDFNHSEFNRATMARRQAGSAFKPIVYTAALRSGLPASEVLLDAPVVVDQLDGTKWRPTNYEPEFDGPMTLRHGLRRSKNMIAIRLGQRLGGDAVVDMASRLGIDTEVERYPSSFIGAAEVIPIQMLEVYSTLATLGTRVRPFPILQVESADGEVLWEPQPDRQQVLNPLVARLAVSLLQDVVEYGTGRIGIRINAGLPTEVPAAGKTGTTNDGADVWFVGFTPDIAAAVWFGMDEPRPIVPLATGGGLAGPVWGDFMRRLYYDDVDDVGDIGGVDDVGDTDDASGDEIRAGAGLEPNPLLAVPLPWPLLEGLVSERVDSKTGHLASRWCPAEDAYVELYLPGTEPTTVCDRESQ